MNKVILIGNLVKKPELRTTTTGKSVATASIATNKTYTDQSGEKKTLVQYHNLVIWGKQGEAFEKYLDKGKKVGIVGEMQTRSWEAQDGTKRYTTEVLVNEFEFLSPAGTRQAPPEEPQGMTEPMAGGGVDEIDVSNIPF
jgi:single-strand DNA-binding protein